MAQSGKKTKNIKILSDIYHDSGPRKNKKFGKNKNIVKSIRDYFSDPKKVDQWISGAVLFFSFLAIFFSFFHFKNQLFNPFLGRITKSDVTLEEVENSQDLLGLNQRDTDQDGISDYDEIYIYETSPYLEDSDSDGISDQKEISSGSDPNCPKGQNCFTSSEITSGGQETTLNADTNDTLLNAAITGGLSVSELRNILLQAGLSPEMLDALSDDQIVEAYQQVLLSGEVAGAEETQNTVSLTQEQINNLSPDEIRKILEEDAGIDPILLSQISDQELIQLVQETLIEQGQ